MPDLKLSDIKSYAGYSGPTRLDHNNFNAAYEKLGSADTTLGRWMGNYYDKNFVPERSQVNQRYENQGSFNSLMSSAFRLGTSVGSGLVSTAGALTTLPALFIPGVKFTDALDANPINHLADGIRSVSKELAPTFIPDDFDAMSFTKQLTSRPTQLFSSSVDSLGFMVEMFAGGGGVAKLAIGAKLASKLAKSRPLYKALTPLQGDNIAKVASAIDFVATNEILSMTESYLESKDSYESNIKKLKMARFNGENDFTDEQIEQAARQSQYNVFWENMITTSVTNGVFTKLLSPLHAKAATSRQNPFDLTFKNNKFQGKEYSSAFDRFLSDKGNVLGTVTKQLVANVLSEGLEEDLQYSIQKVNEVRDLEHRNTFGASLSKYISEFDNLLDFNDQDRVKAVALGSILGGAHVGIGSALKGSAYGEAKAFQTGQASAMESLNRSYTDLTKSTIFKTDPGAEGKVSVEDTPNGPVYFNEIRGNKTPIPKQQYDELIQAYSIPEDGKYVEPATTVTDEKGVPVKDPAKVAKFLQDYRVQGELDNLMDQDPSLTTQQLFNQSKLGKLAETAFDAGVYDILLEKFETANATAPTPEAEAAIDYLKRLEPLLLTANNSIVASSARKDDLKLTQQRAAYAKSLGSRAVAVDNLIIQKTADYNAAREAFISKYKPEEIERTEKLVSNMSAIETLKNKAFRQLASADVASQTKGIENLRTAAERLNSLTQSDDYIKFSKDTQLEGLVKEQVSIDDLVDAREQIGKVFDKVIHPTKGQQFYKGEIAKPLETVLPFDGSSKIDPTLLSTDTYKLYEDKLLTQARYQDKLKVATRELKSAYVDEFVKWMNIEPDTAEIARSLRALIEDTLNSNAPISKDTADKLVRILQSTLETLDFQQRTLDNVSAGESINFFVDLANSVDMGEASEQEEQILEIYNQVEAIKAALGDLVTEYPTYVARIQSLVRAPNTLASDEQLREQIRQNQLNGARRIVFASKFDGESVDAEYTAVSDVEYEINKLTKLHDNVFSKGASYAEPVVAEGLQEFLDANADRIPIKKEVYEARHESGEMDTFEIVTYQNGKKKLSKIVPGVSRTHFETYPAELSNEKILSFTDEEARLVSTKEGKEASSGMIGILTKKFNKENPTTHTTKPIPNSEYKEIAADIRALLPELQKILSLTKANANNQELKAQREADLYYASLLNNFNLSDEQKTKLATIKNPTLRLNIAIQFISEAETKPDLTTSVRELFALKSSVSEEVIQAFLKSPVRGLTNLLSYLQYPTKNDSLAQFKKDYDIVKLIDNFQPLEGHFVTEEIFQKMVKVYLSASVLSKANLQSDLALSTIYSNYIKFLERQKTLKDSNKSYIPAPSLSQERVILEMVRFLDSPLTTSKDMFENVGVLKAPAGAGKSLVVTPFVKEILGLTSTELYTAAPFELAAKNIATAVGTPAKDVETLIKDLQSDSIPSETKVIIVDEAATSSSTSLHELAKAHSEFLNRTGRPVKMLFIYDPNQTSSSQKEQPDIEDIGYEVPSGYGAASTEVRQKMQRGEFELEGRLRFTQNIFDFSPLSTTYRSPVSEIVDIQNEFKTTSTVGELRSSTSSNIQTPTNIMGVHIETGNLNLVSTIQRSIAANPNRSRAVITTMAKKAVYEGEIAAKNLGVTVLTPAQAQSATFDEVYVDIPKTTEDYIHNREMYTATSRASKFLFLSHAGSSSIDPSISDRVTKALEKQTSNLDAEIVSKREDLKALKTILGEAPTPAASAPVTEEGTETIPVDNEMDSTDEEITFPLEVPEIVDNNQVTFQLLHPTNEIFTNTSVDRIQVPPISNTEQVFLVKDTHKAKSDSPSERYVILRRVSDNIYQKAAVLGAEEAKNFSGNVPLDDLVGTDLVPYQGSFVTTATPIQSYKTGFLSGSKLSYTYTEDYTELKDTGDILSVLVKWRSDMGYDSIPTEDLLEASDLKAFKTEKEYLRYFDGVPPFAFKLNTPYLVIKGLTHNGNPLKGQAIRLNSTKLNKDTILKQVTTDSGVATIKIGHVQTLVKYVKQFEDLLEKTPLLGAYSKVKLGVPFANENGTLVDSDGNNFFIFHKLISLLSDRVINNNKTEPIKLDYVSEKGNTSLDAVIKNMPPIDPSQVPEELYLLAAKIDSLMHFGDEDHITSGKLKSKTPRSSKGFAQMAMNALATTNYLITLPDGQFKLLRSYETQGKSTILTGRSLLGPINFERGKYAYNPSLKEKTIQKLTKYLGYLNAVKKGASLRATVVSELINSGATAILREVPFTSADLEAIFVTSQDKTGGFDSISEGFGLRSPIIVKNDDVKTWNLATGFSHVTPTQLSFSTTPQAAASTPPKEVKQSVKQYISNNYMSPKLMEKLLDTFSIEELDEFRDSSPYDTIKEAVENYIASAKLETLATQVVNKVKTIQNLLKTNSNTLEVIFDPSFSNIHSKYGARDTTRLAILTRILPQASVKQLAILGTMFSQNRWYHSTSLLGTIRIDDQAITRLEQLYEHAYELGQRYGITIPEPFRETDEGYEFNLGPFVEAVAEKLGSAIRRTQIQNAPVESETIPVPETTPEVPVALDGYSFYYDKLNAYLQGVDDISDEALAAFIRNSPEYAKRYGIDIKEDTPDDVVIERALTAMSSYTMLADTNNIGDLLTEEEAIAYYTTLNPPTKVGLISRLFGKRGELPQIVSFAELQHRGGKDLWGLFSKGVVYLAKHESGKIGKRVIRHELLHKIFHNYLSTAERARLLIAAREKYGDLVEKELEELMAEEFSDYVATKKTLLQSVLDIFKKILNALGFLKNNLTSLEQFFDLIEGGNYRGPSKYSTSVEREMIKIKDWNFDVEAYTLTEALFFERFSFIYESRKDGNVISFEEAIDKTINQLKNRLSDDTASEKEKEALSYLFKSDRVLKSFTDEFFPNSRKTEQTRIRLDSTKTRLERIREEIALSDTPSEDILIAEEDLAEEVSILEETLDSELVNPASKIVGRVKQRLVFAKYRFKQEDKYGEFAKAYNAILSTLSNVDNLNLDSFIDKATAKLKNAFPFKATAVQSTVGAATSKILVQSFEDLRSLTKSAPTWVSFRKDITAKGEYVLIGENAHFKTSMELPRIVREAGESMHHFIQRIQSSPEAAKYSPTYESLRDAFRLYEELAFTTALITSVASLRVNKPTMGITSYKSGALVNRYIQNRKSGPKQILESYVVVSVIDYLRTKLNEAPFTEEFIKTLPEPDSTSAEDPNNSLAKKKAIEDFLKLIGINKEVEPIVASNNSVYAVFYNSITNFPSIITEESLTNFVDENSMVSAITGLVNQSPIATDATSFTRADGKQAYRYVDASYQSMVLTYISSGGRSTRPSHLNILNDKLGSTTPLVKDNIFIKTASRIIGYIDHDAIKNAFSGLTKRFSQEQQDDFTTRNFDFGFLQALARSRGKHYHQFTPIPSNRTNIQAATVTWLSNEDIKSRINTIIEAKKNRPSPQAAGLENNENYVKNWKIIDLPGFYHDGKTPYPATSVIAKAILDHLKTETDALITQMKDKGKGKEHKVDESDVEYVMGLVGAKFDDKVSFKRRSELAGPEREAADEKYFNSLRPVVSNFLGNFFVNQLGISELFYGDLAFYKSKEDLIKRIQVSTATGDIALIDEKYGLPPVSNVGIIKDLESYLPDDLDLTRDDSFLESFKDADGQGYVTPEFYEKLVKGFSIESNLDVTIKSVYHAIDPKTGSPLELKYALIVLTDELTSKYERLAKLRDGMRAAKLDQAVFNSAVKTGNPLKKNLAKITESGDIIFDSNSIKQIENKYLRIQLNPAKKVDASTSNPSQVTALMNTNGLNQSEIATVHKYNAEIIKLGLDQIQKEFELNEKGGLSKSSELAIRKRLIQMTEDMPGVEDIHTLLSHKTGDDYSVSLNIPLISKKIISSIAAAYTSSSVGFRFEGSKLVLQAQYGLSEKLKFKDKNGYTEVILPEAYRRFYKEGDIINQDIIGFRIPSTNYHSALTLVVKDFYPTPEGSRGNIVIAPSEIVYFHGSDYDIDTLFLLRSSVFDETLDLNETLKKYTDVYEVQDSLIFEEGSKYGYDGDKKLKVDGVDLGNFLKDEIDRITRLQRIVRNSNTENKADKLKDFDTDIEMLTELAQKVFQNYILSEFSTNLQDKKNRTDLLTPISTNTVGLVKQDLVDELYDTRDLLMQMLLKEGTVQRITEC